MDKIHFVIVQVNNTFIIGRSLGLRRPPGGQVVLHFPWITRDYSCSFGSKNLEGITRMHLLPNIKPCQTNGW